MIIHIKGVIWCCIIYIQYTYKLVIIIEKKNLCHGPYLVNDGTDTVLHLDTVPPNGELCHVQRQTWSIQLIKHYE